MVQKDKSLNDLTKRLKEFLENQIQELESATTDIANNNAVFVGEITKVRANIISAAKQELARVSSKHYITTLVGTLGRHPIE